MVWARKGWLAVMFGSVLSTMGCCYHAAHFGKERDIGIGKIGCGASCESRCAPCSPCTPGTPGGLPPSVRPTAVVPASYESDVPPDGRDNVGFRRAAGSDLPIYVLPQDSVSNAMVVSPSPLPAYAPRQTR